MMVTFASQCEKKALNRTRRVLDAFANRIGDNTWQTVITEDGLLAVKKLLRKTASKNTAVACHWIRSRSRTELVWVVGNKRKFNNQGLVPVNSTKVNHPPRDDRADWHYLPVIQALTALAALFHDWGKASARFQVKLSPGYKGKLGDAFRHEWVSCLLLRALINKTGTNSDERWLDLLAKGDLREESLISTDLASLEKPLAGLPPIAQMVAWLILTHHRLPLPKQRTQWREIARKPADELEKVLLLIDADWGYQNTIDNWQSQLKDCLRFPEGLMSDSQPWIKEIKRWSNKLLNQQALVERMFEDGIYRLVLHHARLCLMLGDHYYSSLEASKSGYWKAANNLIANTQKDGSPKQALDQHLVGVYRQARQNVWRLPQFEQQLPETNNINALRKKSVGKFAWQQVAFKKIIEWKKENKESRQGFFAVNMASTGCGKTFANAKVMLALSEDGDNLRYTLALGLRTLTLQTGDEYRERIFQNSNGSDLAVLIGSKAITELHQQATNTDEKETHAERQGSESQQSLLDSSDEVLYPDDISEDGLATLLHNNKDRKFLYAPILACTIDHIMAATETTRGGRYILPSLRMMTSDLVIDEVDDFTGSDAIAIGRLIHLAGMLGRKVMISSATIPPALAEGYYNCYREGWQLFAKSRTASQKIGCAWIDEFTTQVTTNTDEKQTEQYTNEHNCFIDKRVANLSTEIAKRKVNVVECPQILDFDKSTTDELDRQSAWFEIITREALNKHGTHCICDEKSGLNVSFGVIRIANIPPCLALTRFLLDYDLPGNTEIRVMAYHSQQVLLLRHAQEKHLDIVLKRKEKPGTQPVAFQNKVIRKHLDSLSSDNKPVSNLIFILVATPVEEVGRDHDFDWAIIEPSSYRSIIQLGGRVRRHRDSEVGNENIGLLQYNWRTLRKGEKPEAAYFNRPGFETETPLSNGDRAYFKTHDISKLLDLNTIEQRLDAIPRIQRTPSTPPFAQLEHAVITDQLNNKKVKGADTLQGYLTQQWFLTALPQRLHRFRNTEVSIKLFRALGEDTDLEFWQLNREGRLQRDDVYQKPINFLETYQIKVLRLNEAQQSRLWLKRDYKVLLEQTAEKLDLGLSLAILRYGELLLRENQNGEFFYNDQLGLFKRDRR